MKILDGRIIRDEIIIKLKKEIESFKTKPTLAIIQIGDFNESNKYIKSKKSFGEKIGAEVRHIKFGNDITQTRLKQEIEKLNQDPEVHGIILQLPIPENLNGFEIIETIDPRKDVDGLTTSTPFVSATAKGILTLLDYYKVALSAKKIVVMGRSRLVGQPTTQALLRRQALVEMIHSQTVNPKEITRQADILVVAIGKPNLVDDSYVRVGQTVIDVGINFKSTGLKEEVLTPNQKLVGDVDFEKVKNIVSAITPVPGGVGAMTVASLFENLVEAYKNMV